MNRQVSDREKRINVLARLQGIFYLVTGLWPVFEVESFMAVTGPKTDIWLVRTVGLLIAATGSVLLVASQKKELNSSIIWLAILNASALAAVDIFYSLSNVISDIYLLDAAVEIAIIIIWFFIFPKKEQK